tara:strand:+ start:5167 stop:5331 length:165 start_codon:yes stop_codon:yes gene_type:complete
LVWCYKKIQFADEENKPQLNKKEPFFILKALFYFSNLILFTIKPSGLNTIAILA